jgi:site-specific DNA-methyltransferase (adenine-specific)
MPRTVPGGACGDARRRIRDLKGVLEREKAEIGLFVTLDEPSAPMRQEAATAGVYHSDLSGRDYQRIQILTVRDLLEEHRRHGLAC